MFKNHIAIVGLSHAGKTVFLTSLLAHLKNHEPAKLRLHSAKKDHTVQLRKFKEVEDKIPPFAERFNWEKNLNTLFHQHTWPGKTKDVAYFRCRFERSDWRWRSLDLTFLDFPGERFCDVLMAPPKEDGYAAWSDNFFRMIDNDYHCRQMAADYLRLLDNKMAKFDTILFEYKKLLAKWTYGYRFLVVPSVFLLDTDGNQIQPGTPEEIARVRLSGLTPDTQFAPLHATFRSEHSDMTQIFAAHYQQYYEAVPEPLFQKLSRCEKLVILIDIQNLLTANVGRLNDTDTLLKSIFESCIGESGLFYTLWTTLFSSSINRIAFVATKTDMVRYDEVDNVKKLLEYLAIKNLKDYPEIDHGCFTCSAIVSTRMQDGRLYGYPVFDAQGRQIPPPAKDGAPMTDLDPSPLPEKWPHSWQEGDFYYPEVWPRVPGFQSEPPTQAGLEEIINFLFEKE